jgi:hypothetical protein
MRDFAKLPEMKGPVVVTAVGGMCSGAWIVKHLKVGFKEDRNEDVIV